MGRNGPKRQKKFIQNWGSLPSELLDSIVESLPSIYDYIGFRLVCKHWRKVALKQKEQRLRSCHKQLAPLLLLNSTKNSSNQSRALYSITQGKVVHRFNLPNHRDDKDTWLCGSSHGWLAYADAGFMVTLVNPFTRGTIRLPQVMEGLKSRPECKFEISKVVLSANPCLFPNDYEVLVIIENDDGVTKDLAHFMSGNNAWTRCDNRMIDGLDIIGATFYKGRFVALTGVDSDSDHGASTVHPSIECISHPCGISSKTSFLVKSTCEDLLLVNTSMSSSSGPKIFKLGSSCGDGPEWVKMESLGTDALFLDNMNTMCVSASYSKCHPKSIYQMEERVVKIRSIGNSTLLSEFPEQRRPITWIAPTPVFSI